MIPISEWKWFGNAGHLIVGNDCRFHLCTLVGKFLISTVGQYWPHQKVREIHAQIRDEEWFEKNKELKGDAFDDAYMRRFGFQEIGYDRKFETMVFLAGKPCDDKDCNCGLPVTSGSELDFKGYNTTGDATKGHFVMCEKFAASSRQNAKEQTNE